jgi:hypothetical protein
MSPQVVIVTDRFTRLYWLVWGGAAVFGGTLIGLGLIYAYVVSWFHLGWLLP